MSRAFSDCSDSTFARNFAASARSAAFFVAVSARAIAADASRARAPIVCMYSAMLSAFMRELSRGGTFPAQREGQPLQRLPVVGRPVGHLQALDDAVDQVRGMQQVVER